MRSLGPQARASRRSIAAGPARRPLVIDALMEKGAQRIDRPKEAAIRKGDLLAYLRAEFAGLKPFAGSLRSLFADAQADPQTAEAFRTAMLKTAPDGAAADSRRRARYRPARRPRGSDRRGDLAAAVLKRGAGRRFRAAARAARAAAIARGLRLQPFEQTDHSAPVAHGRDGGERLVQRGIGEKRFRDAVRQP